MKDPVVQHCGRLFRAFKQGHLPAPGALRNQSALYRSVIDYCQTCQDDAEAYGRKKQAEQDQKHHQRS